jgi:hypothetical protein
MNEMMRCWDGMETRGASGELDALDAGTVIEGLVGGRQRAVRSSHLMMPRDKDEGGRRDWMTG